VQLIPPPDTVPKSLEFHADWGLAVLLFVVCEAGPVRRVSAFGVEEVLVALALGEQPSCDRGRVGMGGGAGLALLQFLLLGAFWVLLLLRCW
jgi:hypothetical protein